MGSIVAVAGGTREFTMGPALQTALKNKAGFIMSQKKNVTS